MAEKVVIMEIDVYIHKIHLHTTAKFNMTISFQSYHLDTINLAILTIKKGHNSRKNDPKFATIELELEFNKIHLHTTANFNLTFRSHVIIWKPQI